MSSDLFREKVYTVTGAASGMGRATAILLASRGAKVSLCDIQEDQLLAVVEEINGIESKEVVIGTVVDIRDRSQVENWVDKTVRQFGRLDGAANVAGVTGEDLGVTLFENVRLRRSTCHLDFNQF